MMRRSKTVVKLNTAAFLSAFLVAFGSWTPAGLAQKPAAPGAPAAPVAPKPIVPAPAAPPAPAAAAQPPDSLDQLWKSGMDAFNSGKFEETVTTLKSLIAQAPKEAQLEPAFFTLGASYFNLQDYKNAADTFSKLLVAYPKTPRLLDVTFAMAQANMLAGNSAAATEQFKKLESVPQFKQQIPLLLASSYKQSGKIDEAIAILEKMVAPGIQSPSVAKGAMQLIDLYVTKNAVEKAADVLVNLNNHVSSLENVAALNSLAITIGDSCLLLKKNLAALGCYRIVRSKEQVKDLQEQRIAGMEKQIVNNMALLQMDHSLVVKLQTVNDEIRKDIAAAKALLVEIEKLPPIIPPLYIRIASAFYEDGKHWEALVVYNDLMERYPDCAEFESALYASLVTFGELNQAKRTLALCEKYAKLFPTGANIATVIYFQGNIALQAGEFSKAEAFFGVLLKDHASDPLSEQVLFLLGNSKFQQSQFKEAAVEYAKYLKQYPQGAGVEEATYRLAVSILFGGSIDEAIPLIGKYLSKYPNGQFTPDAKYRLMVCLFAGKEYDNVIESAKAWESQFSGDPQLGDVLALQGDSHAAKALDADAVSAKEQSDLAVDAYTRSYKIAANDEVLNYSLFEASKVLQKQGNWEKISRMFEDFVRERPDNPSVTTALFWIGKAKVKLGQTDEAKKFLAETVNKYIDDPSREAVEQIISQLAMLCTKKKPSSNLATTGTGSTEIAKPSPTPADLGAELETLLEGGKTPTAQSRVLYAKAELSRMRRQPEKEEEFLLEIADVCKPKDLSSILLGVVGDALLTRGKPDKAEPYYAYLLDEFPKSDLVDFGYAGMGEIAYINKDYSKALTLFQKGIDSSPAAVKMKDLTVGKAKSLLALNQIEESKKLFTEISAMREWRGEATAEAVFSLGEIEMKATHYPEAIAYYQRVYVGYQKFLPWVAKAYVQSAACFLKIGKNQEAINTYKELLRNDKLRSFPETEVARKAVESAGAQL